MTIREVLHHGNTRDGKPRVKFFQTEREAKSALSKATKDAVAIGRRWADLHTDERLTILDTLQEIESAGLTLRQVWDAYRDGTRGKQPAQRRTLRQAIHEMEQSKRAANRRPVTPMTPPHFPIGVYSHVGPRLQETGDVDQRASCPSGDEHHRCDQRGAGEQLCHGSRGQLRHS